MSALRVDLTALSDDRLGEDADLQKIFLSFLLRERLERLIVILANVILVFHHLFDFLLDLCLRSSKSGIFLEEVASGLELSLNDAKVVEDDVLDLSGSLHL